jgi:hypothetical protein
LAAYVVVLGVQIAVEVVFSGVFFPDIVTPTGIVFTGYRLRQLYGARMRFALAEVPSSGGRAAVRLCLSLGSRPGRPTWLSCSSWRFPARVGSGR